MRNLLFCLVLICVSCTKEETPIKDTWLCGYDIKRSDREELVSVRGFIFSRDLVDRAEAEACEAYEHTIYMPEDSTWVHFEKIKCGCDYEIN